jgi:hypothetical protein
MGKIKKLLIKLSIIFYMQWWTSRYIGYNQERKVYYQHENIKIKIGNAGKIEYTWLTKTNGRNWHVNREPSTQYKSWRKIDGLQGNTSSIITE